jgi:hypothetical protein
MTEQQPTSRQPDTVTFDPEAVGAVLGVTPAAAEDPAHGRGMRYRLGVGQALVVFPDRGVTRMRSGQVNLEIRGLPTVTDRAVVYEYRGGGEQINLHASDHAVSLHYRLGEDSEATADPWATDEPAPFPEPSPAPPAPSDPDPEQSTTSAAPAEQQEAARYRTLTGRVGALPRFDTTARGTPIARFPLAEHRGEDTVWHRIVATDVRARKLHELVDAGAVQKGTQVAVKGRPHTREETDKRTGRPRKVVDFVLAAPVQPATRASRTPPPGNQA